MSENKRKMFAEINELFESQNEHKVVMIKFSKNDSVLDTIGE